MYAVLYFPFSPGIINSDGYESKSLLKSLSTHAREHYPSCSYGVYPTDNDSAAAILLVANKYSPNNFWYAVFLYLTIYGLDCPPTVISITIFIKINTKSLP